MKKKIQKIGIDIRCLGDGKRTGVEEYAINLLSALFEIDKRNKYILFSNSFRSKGNELNIFSKYKNVKIRHFRFPNKILNFFFWYLGWPHVDKMIGGVDVFFMPNINIVALSKKTKLILTIHDISFEHMPEMFSIKRRLWHSFVNPKKLCEKANMIIAVSDSTKNDLISKYGITNEKILRIYSGVSEEYSKLNRNDPKLVKVKDKYKLPFKFVFFLGTIEPRKNIPTLVRAFDKLRDSDISGSYKLKLVIAGSRGWKFDKTILAMRKAKHTKDILFISNVSSEDKNAIYNLSTIFVYPSHMEGFGFPVLEAMKCGVPVIASNTSSMPEVLGNEGVLIDPDKPDEIYIAMKNILEDKSLCSHLKERGWRRSFMFSWKNSSKDFLNVLESL